MKEQKFFHKENNRYVTSYRIWREGDTIRIESDDFPATIKDQENLDWKFFMHAGNVPAVLEAIAEVFRAPPGDGEYKHVLGFNEDIIVGMLTERSILDLTVFTDTDTPPPNGFKFYFDRGEIDFYPEKRKPTKAMIWVMKELEREYKDWKKEQKK